VACYFARGVAVCDQAYMSQLEAGDGWRRIPTESGLERAPGERFCRFAWKERYACELASLPGTANVSQASLAMHRCGAFDCFLSEHFVGFTCRPSLPEWKYFGRLGA